MLAVQHSEGRGTGMHGRLLSLDKTCHDVSSISADNLPPLCSVSIAEILSSPQVSSCIVNRDDLNVYPDINLFFLLSAGRYKN